MVEDPTPKTVAFLPRTLRQRLRVQAMRSRPLRPLRRATGAGLRRSVAGVSQTLRPKRVGPSAGRGLMLAQPAVASQTAAVNHVMLLIVELF